MNVPKLRFKEFDGEWEVVSFKNIFMERNEKTGDFKNYPLYSLTVENGITAKSNRYKRDFLVKKENNFKKVYPNDFVSNPMNMTIGALGLSRESQIISVSGYYNVFYNNSDYDTQFLMDYLKLDKMIWKYKSIATGSLIEKQRVHYSQFIELKEMLPSYEEAKKIGAFFKSLDKKIQLQQQKIDLLQEQKKGFLQKMFPRAGEVQPEIRFEGFTGEWEERKFEDILKEFSIKSKNENEYTVLSSTNRRMEIRDGRVSGISNLGYKIIEDGDLVLSPQNLWLGNININDIGTGLVSPSYKTFKFVNVDIKFIRPQLRTPRMLEEYKNASTQGASVVRRNLELDSFYQIPICIPNENEQNKIGEFFKYLADTIDLHQRKLDLYKAQKQGFMQQMFI